MAKKLIIEKQLGISGDYQYKALRSGFYMQSNWHRNKWIVAEHYIDLYKPKRVLDLGTGSGNFELLFSKKLNEIVGIDYNNEALSFLKNELKKEGMKNVKLLNCDIKEISKIPNLGKFDMIILVDVIEHLEAKSGRGLITYLGKLLNSKGKMMIITPNYAGFWPILERYILAKFSHFPSLENMQHVTRYNKRVLTKEFSKSGYKLLKHSTFNTFSFIFPGVYLSRMFCKLEISTNLPFGNLLLCVFEK